MPLNERPARKSGGGFPVWVVVVLILIAATTVYIAMNRPKPSVPEKKLEPVTAPKPEPALQVKPASKAAEKPPSPPQPAPEPAKPLVGKFAFASIGLGGGGGIYTPAISPADGNHLFTSCDMGGAYYSWDRGKTWRMIDGRELRAIICCKPAWHPTDPLTAYAYGGTEYRQEVKVTHDGGVTWKPVCQNQPWAGDGDVTEIYIDRKNPSCILVGSKTKGVFISRDTGATWLACAGITGAPTGFHIDINTPPDKRRIFAGTSEGVWRSDDGGATWEKKIQGLPWPDIRDLAGGETPAGGNCVLFVTVPSKNVDGTFEGGIYRSDDNAETWRSAMGQGTNTGIGKVDEYGHGDIAQYIYIAMPQNQTDVVYVAASGTGYYPPNHDTVYKTTDSGKTWQFCFNGDPRFKEKNIELGWYSIEHCWDPNVTGISANDNDVNQVLRTDGDKIFLTDDGAKTWRQVYSRRVEGSEIPRKGAPEWKGPKFAWQSVGVEVMTCWDYVIDPNDPKRHYICYTDSGFARSIDSGKSWYFSTEGSPWRNTWYGIVCDPANPGTIYAACSDTHDIPHSTHTADTMSRLPGGVSVSRNYGETWEALGDGLPKKPVTSIVMDPASPPDARTLYVTVIDAGVFKSTDGGKTWVNKSSGLGSPSIIRPYLIQRYHNGNLYCSVTCYRKGGDFPTDGPGLYKSTDGAETWTCITKSLPLGWPIGFEVDPTDENTMYLAASSGWSCRSGGLYKTIDGGQTWRQLFNNETPGWGHRSLGGMFVRTKPGDPKTVYFSTSSHGLWLSHDGGEHFRYVKGIPFLSVHRVVFDPTDPNMMYVTTFGGGVWHGPVEGEE